MVTICLPFCATLNPTVHFNNPINHTTVGTGLALSDCTKTFSLCNRKIPAKTVQPLANPALLICTTPKSYCTNRANCYCRKKHPIGNGNKIHSRQSCGNPCEAGRGDWHKNFFSMPHVICAINVQSSTIGRDTNWHKHKIEWHKTCHCAMIFSIPWLLHVSALSFWGHSLNFVSVIRASLCKLTIHSPRVSTARCIPYVGRA